MVGRADMHIMLGEVDSVEACPCICQECGAVTMIQCRDAQYISYCPQCGVPIKVIEYED